MGVFLAASQAQAACPITVSGASKSQLKTSTDGCNITIDKSGSVTVDSAGAAVTVDSNNTLTVNGKISNTSKTGAIGVLLVGGGADSGFTSGGAINVDGKDATGGIGIEVGSSGYTGDINLGLTSSLVVTSNNTTSSSGYATGLAIFGPLVGNVTLSGSITVTGLGATGVLATAPITGSVANYGIINVRGTATLSTTAANPLAGSAIAIGADVTGGIYNAGPDSSNTGAFAAVIENQSSAPAVYISPSLASSPASLTIGVVLDPDSLNNGFSFLNRGTIDGSGTNPGADATAILIGCATGDTSCNGYTATLTGGIYNSGTIEAVANSGDRKTNKASADATAIEIGEGGSVSGQGIVNTKFIGAVTNGLGGGAAYGVLIDTGGQLLSLDNSGTIEAKATVTDATASGLSLYACAICDDSGTLLSIINSGTIEAVATPLSDASEVTIAVDDEDVAAGQSITFTNSGTVLGDVLFGASNDTLDVLGAGNVVGDISFGSGTNILDITGTTGDTPTYSLVNGAISYDATGGGTLNITIGANGELRTSSATATTLDVSGGGTVLFVLGATAPAAGTGIITTTGSANFDAGSNIKLAFDASLPDSGTYTLIHADGGLSLDPATNFYGLPYLYSLTGNGYLPSTNDLDISFARKTSAQLGLTGNEAAIYGVGDAGSSGYSNSPLIAAARGDSVFGSALMGIGDATTLDSALKSLMPDLTGDTRAVAIALTDQATGAVGARQRTMLDYSRTNASLNLWSQEFAHYLTDNGGSGSPGYDGNGFGLAMGADGGSPANGRFGGAVTFYAGNVQERAPRDSKTNIRWYMASLYSDWRGHVLFFDTQFNGGYGSFTGTRAIKVGGLTRKANGSWTDYLASGGFSTGFVFGDSTGFAFIPQWNVDALYVRENAYTETGAINEDLSISSHNQKSLRTFFGFIMRDNIGIEDGLFEPEIRGGWSYDFLNDPETITAAFPAVGGVAGAPFNLTGTTPASSRFTGGASFSWAYKSWSLGFNYDITASSGAFAHAATITLTGRI